MAAAVNDIGIIKGMCLLANDIANDTKCSKIIEKDEKYQ